jgi:hypothetical protein
MADTRMQLQSPSGLLIEATTGSADGILDQFYEDYDAAFVLENEKEGRDGFAECLALNHGAAYAGLSAQFGPFREFVLIARGSDSGPRIGGANFIAFPLQQLGQAALLSLNLNYVFVNAQERRQGNLKRLIRDLPQVALALLSATNASDLPDAWTAAGHAGAPPSPQTLIFIEQNDPFRMSPEAYALDTRYTGLDQIARIGIWSGLGARIVDFPYVQPPLSPRQAADESLLLAVLGADGDVLSACVVRDHLSRFFGISVLKGADPMRQPTAARQLSSLAAACAAQKPVRLLSSGGLDQSLARSSPGSMPRPASLRDLLRSPPAI